MSGSGSPAVATLVELLTGTRLGSYEIVAALGAGGMGEVYRARDTRLGRSVAIKLLRAAIAHDVRMRHRLEHEAQAVSRLNHPGICTLYDLGDHGGHAFLVMELVEGETLAARLTRGPLPVDLALRHAIEIGEALDHAHRQGITHRDLKPANIMLTRSGAKLLDFGVAKLRQPNQDATRALDRAVALLETASPSSPTAPSPLTEVGELLGTFEYMAPEQIQGGDVDARTDIFAFGAVVYEMLTGRRAFAAATPVAVVGAVLVSEPPPVNDYQPVPAMLERLIRRCLAKDPDERWQHVRDVLIALRWVREAAPDAAGAAHIPSRLRGWTLAISVAVLVAALGAALWAQLRSEPPSRWERTDIAPPPGTSFAGHLALSLALSPDGRALVFRAQEGAVTQLYVRRSHDFVSHALPQTQEAHTPFFAPTGDWVGFFTNDRIYKVSLTSGAAVLIAEAPSLSPGSPGATWGSDGTIVFAAGVSGLMRVSDRGGGVPERLTDPDPARGEVTHMYPQFLPGGGEVLFTVRTDEDGWRLAILSLATGQWEWLPQLGEVAGARYVEPGYVVYAQAGGLFAVPFDRTRRTFGTPVALPESVYTHAVADALLTQFAVSDSGRLAYMAGDSPEWTPVRVTTDGTQVEPITSEARGYRYPRFSPNGESLAVSIEEARSDIYVVDASRGLLRPLTRTGSNTHPSWTPDGTRISFSSRRRGSNGFDLYWIPAEGGDADELLSRDRGQFLTSWSPRDPLLFAFYELSNRTARDIWVAARDPASEREVLAREANERGAIFSRNGDVLAYVSNESERDEVWVRPYPHGPAEQVSRGGGGEPVWSPIDNRLFYRDRTHIWEVHVDPGPPLRIEASRPLFADTYVRAPSQTGRANFDVHPSGREFVMIRSVDRATTQLRVVDDWRQDIDGAAAQGRNRTSVPQN